MSKSKKQLTEEKTKLEAEKAHLMELKANNELSEEGQARLNQVAIGIVDVDGALAAMEEKKTSETKETKENPETQVAHAEGYKPKPGQEDLVHLRVTRGSKFDPETGERLTEPFIQTYSYSEWSNLKASIDCLGLTVEEVCWDPYGEAVEMFGKKE